MLSEQQRQTLLQKTRNNWSQADISAYLTQECGLSLRDAFAERRWAVEIIQDEKTKSEQQEAARPPGEKERIEAEQKARAIAEQEEAERQRVANCHPSYLPDEAHPEKECATCGDPTFHCDCTCKRPSDIPF